jgi:hypothetical protein
MILIGRFNKKLYAFISKAIAKFCFTIFVFEFFILLNVIISDILFFVKYKNLYTSIIFKYSKHFFINIQKY